jgi:hypothetical protein
MSFFTDFIQESFNLKTAKDPESFYMSVRIPSLKETKIDIGYINTYYCKNIRDTGCYFIVINSKFSNVIFAISKTNKKDTGTINKITGSGHEINITWDPCEYPHVQYVINNKNNIHLLDGKVPLPTMSLDGDKTKKLELYIKVITSF